MNVRLVATTAAQRLALRAMRTRIDNRLGYPIVGTQTDGGHHTPPITTTTHGEILPAGGSDEGYDVDRRSARWLRHLAEEIRAKAVAERTVVEAAVLALHDARAAEVAALDADP